MDTDNTRYQWIGWLSAGLLAAAVAAGCSRSSTDAAPAGRRDYRGMVERVRLRNQQADALAQVRKGVQRFQLEVGRMPTNLAEVARLGYIKDVPAPPNGITYGFDPVRGSVKYIKVSDQPNP
jgi:hypothetical protein